MKMSKTKRTTLKRVLWAFIPAVLVLGLGVVLVDGYMIYRLAHPPKTPLYTTPYDFQVILQKPMWSEEKWKNPDGTQSVGWFLTRGQTAPALILSHGYGANRSELLTLSFELWKAGYHVLVYDLRGHGESPVEWSGLGTFEKDDLGSAIDFIRSLKNDAGQDLVDGRMGLYGVDIGGYASLVAASQKPMIKAIAVDSICPDVPSYINYRMKSYIGSDQQWARDLIDWPITGQVTDLVMKGYLMGKEATKSATESIGSPSGRRLLFIIGKDAGPLESTTRDLYARAADQKLLIEVERTRLNRLYDDQSANYDDRVVAFFQEAIPTTPEKEKPVPSRRAKR